MDFILQYTTNIQACTQSIDDIIAAVKTTQLLRNPDNETENLGVIIPQVMQFFVITRLLRDRSEKRIDIAATKYILIYFNIHR